MQQAYLIDGLRSPIGRFGGSLAGVRCDDLAAAVIAGLLERHPQIEADQIDDVILGCANQAGEDNRNVARMAALLAGIPASVPGVTVNRLCASGLSASIAAYRAIAVGEADLSVAGGVEHMTRAPFVMAKADRPFSRRAEIYDTSLGWRFVNPRMQRLYGCDSMGETAENVAQKLAISRSDQDTFALSSQQKAARAQASGRLASEILPIPTPQTGNPSAVFDSDEFIRPDSNLEKLARLKPAFRHDGQGSVTAGNSSGINDGACAILMASQHAIDRYQLKPRARLVATAVMGIEPRIMGLGPVEATRQALQRAQLTLDQIDIIEINEAFAVQVLGCLRQFGLQDDDPRVNPNGGAIALGHPLGMTGARLLLTAALELERRQLRYALCTLCVGVGQGMAAILERTG